MTSANFGRGRLVSLAPLRLLRFVLPRTGLVVSSSRFMLDRPSGLRWPSLCAPDVVMADDLSNPDATIDAMLAHSRRQPSP
jgi:hypothetical protein